MGFLTNLLDRNDQNGSGGYININDANANSQNKTFKERKNLVQDDLQLKAYLPSFEVDL